MGSSHARLALGAAQFGLNYGLTSPGEAVPEAEVRTILDIAAASGATLIDTAAAYGHSEVTLGRCLPKSPSPFRIVTKIASLPETDRVANARKSLQGSLQRLQQQRVYGVLLHRHEDLAGPEGAALYDELRAWKRDGLVEKIGISVYAGSEAEQVLQRHTLDIVQLPVSLFDQRPLQDGSVQRLAHRGVEVHARSVLLQGMLLMQPADLPAHLAPARAPLARLHERLAAFGLTPLQGALAFVLDVPWLSQIILGVHSGDHLRQIIAAAGAVLPFDASEFAQHDPSIVDPRLWRPT